MKKVINRSYAIFILVAFFFIMLGILSFRYATQGAVWATKSINSHLFKSGNLTVAGDIYDADKVLLVSSVDGKRKYNPDFYTRISTLHVVGDKAGLMSTSVQNLYRSALVGYNPINGVYDAVHNNKVGIDLTIRSKVNAAAYKALNGSKGAVYVYNYKTGETICMASAPTYDPENAPSSSTLNNDKRYEGVFLNRCINGLFTPGSTMKIVTAISALENIPDIESRSFKCTGSIKYGDDVVKCSGVHGKLNLEKALNCSCNVVFAQIAVELGSKKLTTTANELGFGKNTYIGKMRTSKPLIDLTKIAKSNLGWAGVGQYTTLVTPVQMAMIAGAIANGGNTYTPTIIKHASSDNDKTMVIDPTITIAPEIATKMAKLLRSNVANYYGDKSFPGLKMAGKTGSAERGKVNGALLRHCWFVGYSTDENFPYAISVVMENQTTGSGFSKAVPVANKVLQAIKQ